MLRVIRSRSVPAIYIRTHRVRRYTRYGVKSYAWRKNGEPRKGGRKLSGPTSRKESLVFLHFFSLSLSRRQIFRRLNANLPARGAHDVRGRVRRGGKGTFEKYVMTITQWIFLCVCVCVYAASGCASAYVHLGPIVNQFTEFRDLVLEIQSAGRVDNIWMLLSAGALRE